jgi:putative transposase
VHRLSEHGTYIVTTGTLHKDYLFRGPERLDLLETHLLTLARQHGVQLEAWAVFSNHYHFVGHTTESGEQLERLLSHLHTATAAELNLRDRTPERAVWYNFRDTRLTFEKSYLARLNYVHQNAVKHGLVAGADGVWSVPPLGAGRYVPEGSVSTILPGSVGGKQEGPVGPWSGYDEHGSRCMPRGRRITRQKASPW